MNKKALLLFVCIFPTMLLGMDRIKSFANRYPKTTGFIIGGIVVADIAALAYFLQQKKSEQNIQLPVSPTRIATCIHISRERLNGDVPYLPEQTECHYFKLEETGVLRYKNFLDGQTEIYEENRKDIRVILKKFARREPGELKTMVDQLQGRVSISFSNDSQTWFDKINCTVLLPRDRPKFFQIQVIGDNGSSAPDRDIILYQNR